MAKFRRLRMRSLLLLILLYTGSMTMGQDYRLKQMPVRIYGLSEGLSQGSVYHIVQDDLGFWWMGTGNGLNRFDGTAFRSWFAHPADSSGLWDNAIRSLVPAPEGGMWIGTDNGFNYFDPRTGNLLRHQLPINSSNRIEPVHTSGDTLWVYDYENGLGIYRISTGEYHTVVAAPDVVLQSIMFRCTGGHCWLLDAARKLHRISAEGRLISYPLNLPELVGDYDLFTMHADDDGVYLIDEGSIHKLDTVSGQSAPVLGGPSDTNIRCAYRDKDGRWWIGRVDGSIEIYHDGARVYQWKHPSIRSGTIYTIIADNEGRLWAGIEGLGAVCFLPERTLFRHLHTGSTPVKLQGNFVRAILQTRDGSWWVGYHESGLQRFDATLGRELPVTDASAFLGRSVYNLIESSDGSLYANTGDAILHLPSGGTHWADVTPTRLKDTRISMLWQHPDGIYAGRGHWFVALTGPNTGNMLNLPRDLTPEVLLTAILAIPSAASWYGYNDGLWQVLASGERLRTEVRYRINHILPLGDTIWVATPFGFGAVNAHDGHILAWYDDASGLPNNYVYGLVPDGLGHLWMGTNRGLVRFHIATGGFRWFSEYDGLQSYEFNTNAFARGRDGDIAFGGVNGINFFHPAHPADTAPDIRPVLATFLVNERIPDSMIPLDGTEAIHLRYFQNNLTFEVRGLATEPGNGLRISIRLEGLDDGWIPHEAGTRARYSNLRPGTYLLWAMVAWPGTHGGTPHQLLTVHIARPFWQTWWFFTLAVLVALAVVVGIIMAVFRYRYHRRLAAFKQQQALAELRMQLARDIHDDIGAGLSRITLMSEMAALKKDSTVLHKVAGASRDMLARLGEIVWALRPKQGSWPELVADLRGFSGALFEDAPMHFTFGVEGDIPLKPVPPDIMHHLLMVWKEALRNALQHSQATEVSATLTFEAKHLRVVVADNGRGMQGQPGRMRGKGLSNMHHRVEAMGGKLEISATEHSGTTIQFTVPV